MVSLRKHISLFLLLVYAFFFASTNLFYHSHHLANSTLVHSHPFSGAGHTHTANQILVIDAVNSAVYEESALQDIPEYIPIAFRYELCTGYTTPVLSPTVSSFSLRAPPASC